MGYMVAQPTVKIPLSEDLDLVTMEDTMYEAANEWLQKCARQD